MTRSGSGPTPVPSVIIRGALVVDGTGSPGRKQDVAIAGDRIAAVGTGAGAAARIIDGRGRILAPGFIDAHSHGDTAAWASESNPKLAQGITTEITGNCGLSVAPSSPDRQSAWWSLYGGIWGEPGPPWPWGGVGSYLQWVRDRRPTTNVGFLAGYGAVRLTAAGLDRAADPGALRAAVDEALRGGALGISLGPSYAPCAFATADELRAVAAALGRAGGVLAVHVRSEGDELIESLEEAVSLARHGGCRLQISHLKAYGSRNWGKAAAALALLEAAAAQGIPVHFDQYPYTAGSTALSACLPPWVHAGGPAAMGARLADPKVRDQIRRDIASGLPGWENHAGLLGWDQIAVTGLPPALARWEGERVTALVAAQGSDPVDVVCALVGTGTPGMILFGQDETVVRQFLTHPLGIAGTDGLYGPHPHPRTTGAYARLLGKYVREEGLLTWEAAIHRMTGRTAAAFGLADRGVVRPGAYADLVLLDPEQVAETGTFDQPWSPPAGIDMVWVNGSVAWEQGRPTAARSGRVLPGASA